MWFAHCVARARAIIDMSSLAGEVTFDRSSLPAADQLALHVDAERFLELVRGSGG
jgi:hypothetical protein